MQVASLEGQVHFFFERVVGLWWVVPSLDGQVMFHVFSCWVSVRAVGLALDLPHVSRATGPGCRLLAASRSRRSQTCVEADGAWKSPLKG